MLIVKHNVTDQGMGSRHRIILCFLFIVAITGIYIFYVCTYGNLGINVSKMKSSSAARVEMTVGNLSKPFAKTTLTRIQKTFFNIYKKFRHQKKQMSGKSVNPSGTTQETYLSCPSRLFLLILIPSRPNAVLNRIAIRLSWAQNFKLSKKESIIGSFIYQVVFVIKKLHTEENGNLIQESRKFGDVLQVDHGGKNLTVISAIERLLVRKCKPEFLLMLSDDKTYVNVPEIVLWLSELNLKVKYVGNVRKNMATAVKYLTNTSINVITFRGEAYILAGKILKKFLYATRIIPPSDDGKNEAMYIKTLTKSLGMTPYNNAGFVSHMFEDLNIPDIDPCTIKKEVFVNDVFRARHILLYAKMIIVGEKPCVNKAF